MTTTALNSNDVFIRYGDIEIRDVFDQTDGFNIEEPHTPLTQYAYGNGDLTPIDRNDFVRTVTINIIYSAIANRLIAKVNERPRKREAFYGENTTTIISGVADIQMTGTMKMMPTTDGSNIIFSFEVSSANGLPLIRPKPNLPTT